MSSILIAYASKYGSTREVAERVAQRLRERGLSVDLAEAARVASLDGRSAVVVGAPYFIGSMMKEAVRFLERHRAALEALPVAVFALGPIHASDDMAEARQQLDTTLGKIEWLEPVAAEMFVGKFDPETLRGLDRLVTKPKASPLHGQGPVDERDWAAIDAWAAALPFAAN